MATVALCRTVRDDGKRWAAGWIRIRCKMQVRQAAAQMISSRDFNALTPMNWLRYHDDEDGEMQ